MMDDSRQRGADFLQRPIPSEIKYVPDSLTERFLWRFANGDTDFDDEQQELLELCVFEAVDASQRFQTEEARAFFAESAAILRTIMAESK